MARLVLLAKLFGMHQQFIETIEKRTRRISLKWVMIIVFVVCMGFIVLLKHLPVKTPVAKPGPRADRSNVECSNNARAWFRDYGGANGDFDRSTSVLKYSSYYRKSTDQCFIIVQNHLSIWVLKMSLWDVGNNVQYGKFVEYQSPDGHSNPTEPRRECAVNGKKCSNADEFIRLAQQYMTD